jgi:hypothetical protein
MADVIADADCLRLPAAYSQGYAHVRVLAFSNPDDPGPLAVPATQPSADNDEGLSPYALALKPVA